MKQYKGFLIDLDGTAFLGTEVITATRDFVFRAQNKGIKILFVTNNASKSAKQQANKMQKMGYNVSDKNFLTTAQVTGIKLQKKQGNVFMIGNEALKSELEKKELAVYDNLNAQQDYDFLKKFKTVVVGYSQHTQYQDLAVASIILQNINATLYATNKDLAIPTEIGKLPGNGSIVELLEKVNQIQAVDFGKPNVAIIEEAIKKIGCNPDEVCLIGDNYNTDILGAIHAKIDSLFVTTGVSTRIEVEQKTIQPTYILDSLSKYSLE